MVRRGSPVRVRSWAWLNELHPLATSTQLPALAAALGEAIGCGELAELLIQRD
jgi:hypothetical protein